MSYIQGAITLSRICLSESCEKGKQMQTVTFLCQAISQHIACVFHALYMWAEAGDNLALCRICCQVEVEYEQWKNTLQSSVQPRMISTKREECTLGSRLCVLSRQGSFLDLVVYLGCNTTFPACIT